MAEIKLKHKLFLGTVWSVIGQFGTLLITLATNVWLARLLSPEEFGQAGIILFFIIISNVLTDGGLGGAIIRKKSPVKEDYSTVFVSNLIISIFCILALGLLSGKVARFYNDAALQKLLIVTSSIIFINAFQITQLTRLTVEMRFKERYIYRFVSIVFSSFIGILLAYHGAGVWSIVGVHIANAFFNTILLWVFEGFYLNFRFRFAIFKELYAFGINTTLASLLNSIFDNIYQLILAKYFSLTQTGLYNQGKRLQDVPGSILNILTQTVIFSSLAKVQERRDLFVAVYNKISMYVLVLLGIISVFFFVNAEALVLLLYGYKWIGAVYYIQLLTIASFFYFQEKMNKIIFKVYNKTKQILYLEYVKKSIQAFSLFIGVYLKSIEVLLIGFIICSIIAYFMNLFYSRKVLALKNDYEVTLVIKITFIATVTIITSNFLNKILHIYGVKTFFTFPIIFLLYILLLNLFKVMNPIKEALYFKMFLKDVRNGHK